MDLPDFVKLRLMDLRTQTTIDLREAADSGQGEATKRNARTTRAWVDAGLRIVKACEDAAARGGELEVGLASKVLGELGLVFADAHPDWREEWRPS